jgi:hypothetical protein
LERRRAGVFGILFDLDVEPREVYEKYKEREEIKQAFDYMKNYLETDETYLGRDDGLRGILWLCIGDEALIQDSQEAKGERFGKEIFYEESFVCSF